MRTDLTRSLCAACVAALTIVSAQAATVTFLDLNTAATGNTANVGGDQTGLSVVRSGDGSAGTGYLYTFSYTNESYDGDATLDTLSFGVRVTGFSGGSATTGLSGTNANGSSGNATLGSNTRDIALITKSSEEVWTVGGTNTNIQVGETFAFSLESFSVTTSQGSYTAALDNFTILQTREGGGNTHPYVIGLGSGSDLQARHWSNNIVSQDTMTFNTAQSPILYVTSATGGATNANWGIKDISFGVDVTAIPEPSSFALLGLCMAGLLIRRRRA